MDSSLISQLLAERRGEIEAERAEIQAEIDRSIAKTLIDAIYSAAMAEISAERETVDAEITRLLKAQSKWASEPIRKYHDAIVAHYLPKLADAMRSAFTNTPSVISAARSTYETLQSESKKATGDQPTPAQQAAQQAAANVKLSPSAAQDVLKYIYGDSYLTAAQVAAIKLGTGVVLPTSVGDIIDAKFWDDWQPGMKVASDFVDNGGLDYLLASAGIDINDLVDNTLSTAVSRFTNALADGLSQGLGADAMAANLEDVVSGNALTTAITETGRAQSAATMMTYSDSGITQYEWLAEDSACPECSDNADNGPYDVPESGDLSDVDPSQPAHPNCRCCYLPVIPDQFGENLAPTSDEGDQTSDEQEPGAA